MARIFGYCIGLVLVAGLCTVLFVVGKFVAMDQLDEQIRAFVEAKLVAHYQGLTVQVRDARRVAGQGIEIRGVRLLLPQGAGEPIELVTIDEMMASCDTDLSRLLTGDVEASHLVIRRLRLNAVRQADGSWSFTKLWPLPRFGSRSPEVTLEDASVQISDAGRGDRPPCILRDIRATLGRLQAEPVWPVDPSSVSDQLVVSGSFTGNHLERGRFSARVDPDGATWDAHGSVTGLDISRRFLQALPERMSEHLSPLAGLQARAHLDFQLRDDGTSAGPLPFRFVVSGQLVEGRVDSSDLTSPVTDLDAQIYCDNSGLRVDKLQARCGGAVLNGSLQCGFHESSPLTLHASAKQLRLEEQLVDLYPEKLADIWSKFSPSGMVNVELTVVSDGGPCRTELYVECLGVSLLYDKFPYRVHQARGVLHCKDGRLTIQEGFQALAGEQTIHLAGVLQHSDLAPTGWFELRADGPIPLDYQLMSALEPKHQAVLSALQPSGQILVHRARLERSDPAGPLDKQLDLSLQDGTVRYVKFPYPISGVQGKILLRNERWEFLDLSGSNDTAHIVCHGAFVPQPARGGLLALDFQVSDVPLEDELRDALAPDLRELWTSMRPRGTLDQLEIALRYDTSVAHPQVTVELAAQKWPPQQNVEGRSMSVEPVWFPWRLDEVTGSARFQNGIVYLENISALHGKTRLKVRGTAAVAPQGQWALQLNRLTVDQLELDRSLLGALPPRLSKALGRLHLKGPVNVQGLADRAQDTVLRLEGPGPGQPLRAAWSVSLDMYDNSLSFGIPLEHIHGTLHLNGTSDERGFRSAGRLELDSLHVKQIQLTQLRGPLWIDQSRVALGLWTRDQLQEQARSVSAQLFGGELEVDALVSLEDEQRFDVRAELHEADLARISRTTTGRSHNLSGSTAAAVRVTGSTNGVYTLTGEGAIQLRDADIYQLPVMVSLLKLLSVRPPDTTAFTTSDIHFNFQGDQLIFDRIDFNGDVISLRGYGKMDFQGQMDLSFYTMVGRQELQLPLPRMLLGEASRQFLEIQVTGTVDDPNIQRTAFPAWNETLQQLFPEMNQDAAAPPLWKLPRPREVLSGRLLPWTR